MKSKLDMHLNSLLTKGTRSISFFGRKKPAKSNDPENVFDIKSCIDQKTSSLKVRESCSLEGCCSVPKVIVVGGGLTGLSAAARLLYAGVKDLLLLEATSRLGGRIMSAWVGDAMIEFGPTVLYGASLANPLFNLANMSDAITYPVKRLGHRQKLFLTSDGELITDYSVERLMFEKLISDAKNKKCMRSSCSCDPTCNLMQYLGLRIQQELLNLPPDLQKKADKVLWGMLNSMRVAFGAELSEISADALADKRVSPGGSVILEGGMHRILSPLLQELPEDKILLNKPVHKIMLDPCPEYRKAVKVITCDNCVFDADYVVVTVPLGVLKSRGNDMFDGALTTEQVNAIKNIGVGRKNHVYLEYAHPWWIPGMPSMSLAWKMEELQLSTEWTKGVGFIHEVPGSKHLLVVEIAGPEAELIEGVAEEEVAIQVTKFLRKFTGDTSIPFPSNIVVTRWTCDPFFQGSTVYMGRNTTPGMFRDLAGSSCEPPVPPIIIAGDAAIPNYYGTMEGARRSGLAAANKIIVSTKIKCEDEFRQKMEDMKKEEEEKCESSKNEAQQSCC